MTKYGHLRACSVLGTIFKFHIDTSGFSLRSGWDSMEAFGKRIFGLAAFIFVSAAMVPLWVPGQTRPESRIEYQSNENAKKLAELASLPADILVIKQRLDDIAARTHENTEDISQNRMAAFIGITGVLSFVAAHLFSFFGGRVRRKDE